MQDAVATAIGGSSPGKPKPSTKECALPNRYVLATYPALTPLKSYGRPLDRVAVMRARPFLQPMLLREIALLQ